MIQFYLRTESRPESTRMISVPSNVSFPVFFGRVSLELDTPARMRLALANKCEVQYPCFTPLMFGFRMEDAGMSTDIPDDDFEASIVPSELKDLELRLP